MQFDDAAWVAAHELLILSAVRLARAVVPEMKKKGKGSIVFTTSSSVKEPNPTLALSNVERSGVASLAKTLANELAPAGIRVNCVVPGRIDTDRVRELDTMKAKREGTSVEEQKARSEKLIPLGRYGTIDEYARPVAFLLSDAASYVTGATLLIDGGMVKGVQ
jgi:3-oxoacyl-[acyl-carrier protein] reductase